MSVQLNLLILMKTQILTPLYDIINTFYIIYNVSF